MGNHSTKLVEKPENYEEHEYQGGLHIFNIEGNVEGMYMVAYFGIVFLFVMVFCLCCVMCCESRRTHRLGRRMRQRQKSDFRLASISTYAIPFGRLLKQRFHAPYSKPANDPRGQRGTRDKA
jgi:hypothetical protein